MTFCEAPLDARQVKTREWLSQALSMGRDRVEVGAVDVVETLGPSALKIRMKLDYAQPRPDLPDAVCLKGIFDPSLKAWLASGAQRAEALFYRDVAPGLNVRVPKCVYAGVDDATGNGVIIMEDLVPKGVRFLSAMSPYTPEQARGSLEQIAALHAGTWDLADEAYPWVRSSLENFGQGSAISAERLSELMAGERGEPLGEDARSGAKILAAIAALARRGQRLGRVFVHGDTHGGNVYESAGGIGLIDWQVLQRAHWSLDVAYHVAAALDIEDRRASERDLLAHYLDRLGAFGGKPPAFDEAWQAYREAVPYGLLMWAMTQRVEPQIVNRFVARLGTAVQDHGSFALLGV